jgi:hypothetical protein
MTTEEYNQEMLSNAYYSKLTKEKYEKYKDILRRAKSTNNIRLLEELLEELKEADK